MQRRLVVQGDVPLVKLTPIDGKLNTPSTDTTDNRYVLRSLATLTQSCETCHRSIEQVIREQSLQELSEILHASVLKATSALQIELSALTADVRELKNVQPRLRYDESLDSCKELIQQEVEEFTQRTSSHWDARFAQLSDDIATTKRELAQARETIAHHNAAVLDVGKIGFATNGDAKIIELRNGETHSDKTAMLKLTLRMDEIQAAVEAEVSQTKISFDIHRQMLASLSQRMDTLKDKRFPESPPWEAWYKWDKMECTKDEDGNMSRRSEADSNHVPLQVSEISSWKVSGEWLPARKVSAESLSPSSPTASPKSTNAKILEKQGGDKRVIKSASTSALPWPRTEPTSPTLKSRSSSLDKEDEEESRQKYLRLVPVQYRKALAEHEMAQPWLDKSWAEKLEVAEKLCPVLMGGVVTGSRSAR